MRSGKEKNVRLWMSAAILFGRARHRQEDAKVGRIRGVERVAVLKEHSTVRDIEDIVVRMEVKIKDKYIGVKV